ncbi:hypothetical protein [Fodinibius salsisoli]|uniref:Uncharacterized protein n=1 Tax=Fodinibius salsisoli TaxID=2820877 RepID=A0ABT3PQU3_9BACT|nr:hypothetical protein [Fodinibius salsisoli]MCW9708211.1 hypothetical protein [Fodinibius salsisoli]
MALNLLAEESEWGEVEPYKFIPVRSQLEVEGVEGPLNLYSTEAMSAAKKFPVQPT